jgi:hypothetical protein
MFARRLIPITPLLIVAGALALQSVDRKSRARLGACFVVAAACPMPVLAWWGTGSELGYIVDEKAFYGDDIRELRKRQGLELARVFHGIDASFVISGGMAMLAYHAGLPHMLEHTGLTDRELARTPLTQRGRPGHEKQPDLAFLKRRRIQFAVLHQTTPQSYRQLVLERVSLVLEMIYYDDHVMTQLLQREGTKAIPIAAVIEMAARRISALDCTHGQAIVAELDDYYFLRNQPARESRLPLQLALQQVCAAAPLKP